VRRFDAVFADVRTGLRETVASNVRSHVGERCSGVLDLPGETDTEQIARAIDLENVEAWRDADERVHVGLSPWLSTKDVDQTFFRTSKSYTFCSASTPPIQTSRNLSNKKFSGRSPK
jgi:hypothetical protein